MIQNRAYCNKKGWAAHATHPEKGIIKNYRLRMSAPINTPIASDIARASYG
jgi:hypothetical protein